MTEFHEDRDLKRRMSRRAWREGKVGRRCRVAMLLLALAAPLCALAAHRLMVSSLRPWEYDEAGLLGITLVAGSVPLTVAACVWRVGYQMANPLTYCRVGQQATLDWPWLMYRYRTYGDTYHGTGGWHHVVARLDGEDAQVGWDEGERVVALRGDVRWSYVTGADPGPMPAFDSMEPLEMVLIADCMAPSLHDALREYVQD